MTRLSPSHVLLAAMILCMPLLAASFVPHNNRNNHRASSTSLNGINEWRDLVFDYAGDEKLGAEQTASPPRRVNILPFPFDQILLQGETKQLRLYEDRFIKLFDDTQANHCGVVAMGLLASSGLVHKVPLCEIEAYNRMDEFGIFVTVRVVGRAELVDIEQQDPYISAVCREISDSVPPNLELPSLVAQNIEDSMAMVSKMESALLEAKEKEEGGGARISRAKLEDRFYEEKEEEDEDEDDDDDPRMDRQNRYQTAYRIALRTDTQGYCVTDASGGKTPQELTAVSWAAFCTDMVPEAEPTARIKALDSSDLFERLKLASQSLKQKEAALKAQLVKAGIDIDNGKDGSSTD